MKTHVRLQKDFVSKASGRIAALMPNPKAAPYFSIQFQKGTMAFEAAPHVAYVTFCDSGAVLGTSPANHRMYSVYWAANKKGEPVRPFLTVETEGCFKEFVLSGPRPRFVYYVAVNGEPFASPVLKYVSGAPSEAALKTFCDDFSSGRLERAVRLVARHWRRASREAKAT